MTSFQMDENDIQKKNPTNSFINETRCRHNHKTRYKLNVSKNDLEVPVV